MTGRANSVRLEAVLKYHSPWDANFIPRPAGDLPPAEVESFAQAGGILRRTYTDNLADAAFATASTSATGHGAENAVDGNSDTWWEAADSSPNAWLQIDLEREAELDRLVLREAITQGQTIAAFRLLVEVGGAWREVCSGGTVGRQRIAVFPPASVSRLRVALTTTGAPATLREVGCTGGRTDAFGAHTSVHAVHLSALGLRWGFILLPVLDRCLCRRYSTVHQD